MKSGTRNSVKQTIGKQLRKIREDLKLPAREAGKGIGVNPSYIYLIEKGDGSMETMDKLARFYGYDLKILPLPLHNNWRGFLLPSNGFLYYGL
ncbi:helix-turn-helix transcriptional regulator [Bacillus megaterium]|nr:helix-turn-helix transcriptional regulator [Priestia megaterium]